MKNKKNIRIEYTNGSHEGKKKSRRKWIKRKMIMCFTMFAVALASALLVGHQVREGNKKVENKEENVKKPNVESDYTKPDFPEPTVQIENKQRTIDPNKPMVALTFDDGPGLRTMELLKVLKENNARATFFTCGTSLMRKDIDIENVLITMQVIGCEISNHTMEHKKLSKLSKKEIISQVNGVNKILRKYTGNSAAQLRPPYGDGIHNKKVIKNVGMPMICWSIDTLDWKTKNKKKIIKKVMKNVQDGDIILMHDIHSRSVDAAIEIIPKLIKKGYQLVTVSELAQARGIELEEGKVYFDFHP